MRKALPPWEVRIQPAHPPPQLRATDCPWTCHLRHPVGDGDIPIPVPSVFRTHSRVSAEPSQCEKLAFQLGNSPLPFPPPPPSQQRAAWATARGRPADSRVAGRGPLSPCSGLGLQSSALDSPLRVSFLFLEAFLFPWYSS